MANVARRAAGSLHLIKSSLSVCMNTGRGRAWYDAQSVTQPDGSTLHPHVLCYRETGRWECEILRERTAIIEVERDGRSRGYEFELPLELDISDARRLIALTFELMPTLLNSHRCEWEPDLKNPEEGKQKAFGIESFDPASQQQWNEIIDQEQGVAVVVNGSGLNFVRTKDGNDWQFSCWSSWVVVA